jgi:hypothetical protein
VAWFFRVRELGDGSWQCQWGSETFDNHTALADAIEHCSNIAAQHRPAEVFVHRLDGAVQSVAILD